MKERIKTFILILLIIGSICLTSITWIHEGLWPEGYSLFVNVKNWPIIRNFLADDYSAPLDNLGKARKIVIADGSGASAVYYNSDRTFDEVYGSIKNLLEGFLKGDSSVTATTSLTKEDLRKMLNEQIMYAYVNYPVATTPKLYGRLMGISDSSALSEISAVRDFFILPTGEKSIELLAVDYEDESVMRYELEYENTDKLITAFTEYVTDVDPAHNCTLALETNMDIQSPSDAVKMTAVLNSFLVMDSASTAELESAEIASSNPISETTQEALSPVVSCFGYNPKSIYRYVDSDGTVVYLENDSSLKIYKNGIIEFEALDSAHGVPLAGGTSLYESLNSAIRLAGGIYSAATSNSPFQANVESDLLYTTGAEMHFDFDYYCVGTPVVTDIVMEEFSMSHAIEMTVIDGRVTSLRMLLRKYSPTGNMQNTMTIYNAIDKIASDYATAETPVKIDDIFLSYTEDGQKAAINACWVGYADGKRVIIEN